MESSLDQNTRGKRKRAPSSTFQDGDLLPIVFRRKYTDSSYSTDSFAEELKSPTVISDAENVVSFNTNPFAKANHSTLPRTNSTGTAPTAIIDVVVVDTFSKPNPPPKPPEQPTELAQLSKKKHSPSPVTSEYNSVIKLRVVFVFESAHRMHISSFT